MPSYETSATSASAYDALRGHYLRLHARWMRTWRPAQDFNLEPWRSPKELCRQLGTSAIPSRSSKPKGPLEATAWPFSLCYIRVAKATMKSPRTDHWLHSNSQQGLCACQSQLEAWYQTAIILHFVSIGDALMHSASWNSTFYATNGNDHRNRTNHQ